MVISARGGESTAGYGILGAVSASVPPVRIGVTARDETDAGGLPMLLIELVLAPTVGPQRWRSSKIRLNGKSFETLNRKAGWPSIMV